MTESSAHGAQNQRPGENGEKPEEKPVHQWPDSFTIQHLVTELATGQAAAEIEREDPDFRFSASMHDSMCSHSPGCGNSLRLAPGIDAAVAEAVRAYQPSDMLYEVPGRGDAGTRRNRPGPASRRAVEPAPERREEGAPAENPRPGHQGLSRTRKAPFRAKITAAKGHRKTR